MRCSWNTRDGMAKISFFDLDSEFQRKHGFDPVEALDRYEKEKELQKKLKWERFWEAQEFEAKKAEEEAREKLIKVPKRSWIPVEAKILSITNNGGYAAAKQITFVPTKTKSTLGFEIDGPPRKTLVRMKPDVIFLQVAGIQRGEWEGYIEPEPRDTVQHPFKPKDEVPSYRGPWRVPKPNDNTLRDAQSCRAREDSRVSLYSPRRRCLYVDPSLCIRRPKLDGDGHFVTRWLVVLRGIDPLALRMEI